MTFQSPSRRRARRCGSLPHRPVKASLGSGAPSPRHAKGQKRPARGMHGFARGPLLF